ncbi:hypothetical protein J2N86_14900 (plasmid) [Legionella lytica]|uniref:Cyclic nucleotide-binding domain-containing protein n=1 Tax=Legionella lytica TaxID=96232 RepID=A0ABY4YCX1_9GAMM|nr:hypothetical protein [Legionella lytica]USQ15248.1 hypothetical protein J2N86_14900 [Legionella lytica]
MQKKSYIPPVRTYDELRLSWEKLSSMDIRTRKKKLSQLAYDVCNGFEATDNVDHLQFYISILRQAINAKCQPTDCILYLTKIITKRLELTNNADIKLLISKSKKIALDRTLIIADTQYHSEILEMQGTPEDVYLVNQGKAYIICDAIYESTKIEIRLVEAAEPLLAENEFKRVDTILETAIMHFPSGKLSVADFMYMGIDLKKCFFMDIEPGYYKVCAYRFISDRTGIKRFCIVLCKTDDIALNSFSNIFFLD